VWRGHGPVCERGRTAIVFFGVLTKKAKKKKLATTDEEEGEGTASYERRTLIDKEER